MRDRKNEREEGERERERWGENNRTNIRQGWKRPIVQNALAYCCKVLIATIKKFMAQAKDMPFSQSP